MKNLDINHKKVIGTKELLINIIQDPNSFKNNEMVKSALKSQGNLAKFKDQERDIVSCSLNTLKSACESLFDQGFSELDYLRKSALDAIKKSMTDVDSKANKSTKSGLKNMVDELETSLLNMRKSNFLLTLMISELLGELKRMAESENPIDDKLYDYKEINKKVEEKFSYISIIKDFEDYGVCKDCVQMLKGDN
ncbi:hypothetical protein ACFSJQ_09870 [Vibrio olivae]|uniref:Uncharacterized protein n=1 Tax=Vibrio olivae TaxID=1243002 RepID=A0ABV5HH94_9VIBR